jgi:exodeoxyribonuclease-3
LVEKASIRWRIDLQCTTPGIAAKAVEAYVERAATHAERWSDHAPVTVVYDHDF